jgi:hypothetical protein
MCSVRPAYSTVKRTSSAGVARWLVKVNTTGRNAETYEWVLLTRQSSITTGLNEASANAAVARGSRAHHTTSARLALRTNRDMVLPEYARPRLATSLRSDDPNGYRSRRRTARKATRWQLPGRVSSVIVAEELYCVDAERGLIGLGAVVPRRDAGFERFFDPKLRPHQEFWIEIMGNAPG